MIQGRSLHAIKLLLTILLCMNFLGACSFFSLYGRNKGINYIVSRGTPPVTDLIWSHSDPDKILVTSVLPQFRGSQILIIDLSTNERQVVAKTRYGELVAITWSPDNTQILLQATLGTENFETGGLWLWNSNSDIKAYSMENKFLEALWSPDGKTIVVVEPEFTKRTTFHFIDVVSNTRKSEYTIENMGYVGGSWAPDNQRLVLSLGNDNDGYNLYVLDTITLTKNQITTGGVDFNPAWSPSGEIIAYEAGRVNRLYRLISPDGKCTLEVPNIRGAWSLSWLPEGNELGFLGDDGIYTLVLEKVFGRDLSNGICP